MLTPTESADWTVADFRAARARQQIPIFKLAATLGIHPFRLGQILNERLVMTPRMARKIAKALGLSR